jgi:hypothetical protein
MIETTASNRRRPYQWRLDAALRNAFGLSERWLAMPPVEMKSLVRKIVERVTVAADRIEIRLRRKERACPISISSSYRSRRSCDAPARGTASSLRMAPRLKSTQASPPRSPKRSR